VFVRHRTQLLDQLVEPGQQHFLARLVEHQGVAEVVDVLARAGEVDELQRRTELGIALELFLDQVLDRLDVVVGGALDFLHPRRVGDAEVVGQRTQPRGRRFGKRRQAR
jgi:glutathione S-transferase